MVNFQRKETNPEKSWFGFSAVNPAEKTRRVEKVFSSVAQKYDLMNDLMSFGFHHLWKKHLVSQIAQTQDEVMLDVAGGTGDISILSALRYIDLYQASPNITVCDLNADMIKVGMNKSVNYGVLRGIDWIVGNAEQLPFPDNHFDILVIAFGLRNVTRIDDALRSFYRVLKPTGRFFCLEFSPGVNPLMKRGYEFFCAHYLPLLGEVVAQDRGAYQYLYESIQQFPVQSVLADRIESAGFSHVSWENMCSGAVALHKGWK